MFVGHHSSESLYHPPRSFVKNLIMEKIRRYDLDWLRVMVFGLLIFYHVGMFFVPWGWHIKNNEIIGWLRYPMLFLNQWRLPILFVISGMGTAYALAHRSGREFRIERWKRLGVPLLFGMLFIVPPQVYIERLSTGAYQGDYLSFIISGTFINGIYPEGNFSWHHLWFLPYLLVFSLILSPLFVKIRGNSELSILQKWRARLEANPWKIYWFVLPLFLYESLLEPFFNITHNLVWDWFNFVSSLTLFFFGFFLINLGETFWTMVERMKSRALIVGVICFTLLILRWTLVEQDNVPEHFAEAFLKTVNLWSWILVLCGFSAKYLNRESGVLAYANQAVYPFYILHQTITIIIGYQLMNLDWSFWPKALVMVIGTFAGAWILYEFLIRRVGVLKPLFGLKR